MPLLIPLATLQPGFESGLRSLPVNPEAFCMVSTVCHPQGSPSVHLGLLSREEEWHSQCHSHPSEGNPHSLKSHSLSKHTSPRRQPSESHSTPGDRRRYESPLLGMELIVLEQTLFSIPTSCLVPLSLPSPGLPGAQQWQKATLYGSGSHLLGETMVMSEICRREEQVDAGIRFLQISSCLWQFLP